jgi:hypothetical protein
VLLLDEVEQFIPRQSRVNLEVAKLATRKIFVLFRDLDFGQISE